MSTELYPTSAAAPAAGMHSRQRRAGAGFSPRWVLPGAVLLFCLASSSLLFLETAIRLNVLGEAGYGDLYVFHTVQQFQKNNVIYQDLTQELPSVYGPMLYTVLAVSGRLWSGPNPLLGPRLIVITAFLLCVVVLTSLARTLIPHRKVWLWSVPLALSFASMSGWTLQIRGDFLAIFFSLLAVRLLLARTWPALLAAGACAGFATQFKFTFIAAMTAGLLWLLGNRRWKDSALFGLGAGLTSLGIYAFFIAREPRLLSHVLALRNPIVDYAGLAKVIFLSLGREPVALLGLATLPFLSWRWRSRWTLLLLFTMVSFGIAAVTYLQSGAAVNYFFESLFGLVPVAALGVLKMHRPGLHLAGLLLAGFLIMVVAAPIALAAFTSASFMPREVAAKNLQMMALQNVFRDQKVFALVPEVAFFAPEVVLSDPFLARYMELRGKFDFRPLAGRIRRQSFDLIVAAQPPPAYRGIIHMSPTLRPAMAEAYRPFCILNGRVMLLPRNAQVSGTLSERLTAAGCDAAACVQASRCNSW